MNYEQNCVIYTFETARIGSIYCALAHSLRPSMADIMKETGRQKVQYLTHGKTCWPTTMQMYKNIRTSHSGLTN